MKSFFEWTKDGGLLVEKTEAEEVKKEQPKCPQCGSSNPFKELGYMACMLISRCEQCGFVKQVPTGSCG